MRLTSLALAAVLSAASLTACSGDGDELSKEQLDAAVLTVKDLSDDFEVDDEEYDDDDEGPDWGCLNFDELDKAAGESDDDDASEHEREATFGAKKEPGMPGIFQLVVDTGAREESAEEGMDKLADVLLDCKKVDSTEEDGTHWQFDVEADRVAWADGADEQINLVATGSTASDDFEFPIVIHLNVVRVGPALTILGFFDMTEDTGDAPRALLNAASARLAAVVDGEDPPEAEPLLEDYPIGEAFEKLLAEQAESA